MELEILKLLLTKILKTYYKKKIIANVHLIFCNALFTTHYNQVLVKLKLLKHSIYDKKMSYKETHII